MFLNLARGALVVGFTGPRNQLPSTILQTRD
jgi:hypothetical protein